jgi:hypothetical protein
MLSTADLTWIPADRVLVGELSDLGPNVMWVQAWPDSADLGLDIRSEWTGRVLRCYVKHQERAEGELLWLDLEPTDPKERTFTIRLYND